MIHIEINGYLWCPEEDAWIKDKKSDIIMAPLCAGVKVPLYSTDTVSTEELARACARLLESNVGTLKDYTQPGRLYSEHIDGFWHTIAGIEYAYASADGWIPAKPYGDKVFACGDFKYIECTQELRVDTIVSLFVKLLCPDVIAEITPTVTYRGKYWSGKSLSWKFGVPADAATIRYFHIGSTLGVTAADIVRMTGREMVAFLQGAPIDSTAKITSDYNPFMQAHLDDPISQSLILYNATSRNAVHYVHGKGWVPTELNAPSAFIHYLRGPVHAVIPDTAILRYTPEELAYLLATFTAIQDKL